MKPYRLFALSLSFVLLIVVSGCPPSGGGNDSGDHGTAPTITDVNFYKCDDPDKNNSVESYSYNYGDYYYRKIYLTDPDLDVRYIHWMVYEFQNGQYVEDFGPEVTGLPTQASSPYIYENINGLLITATANSYRHDFQLEDEEGNMSNTFRVFVIVD